MSLLMIFNGHSKAFVCHAESVCIDAQTVPGNALEPMGMVDVHFRVSREHCQIIMTTLAALRKLHPELEPDTAPKPIPGCAGLIQGELSPPERPQA